MNRPVILHDAPAVTFPAEAAALRPEAPVMKVQRTVTLHAACAPEQLWEVLIDVERWPEWQPGVERVRLCECLRIGAEFQLARAGWPTARVRLRQFYPARRFFDVVELPWARFETHRHLHRDPEGTALLVTFSARGLLSRWWGAPNLWRDTVALVERAEYRARYAPPLPEVSEIA